MLTALILRTLPFLLFSPPGQAIWLNLPSSRAKCVSEEIQSNTIVMADYTVVQDDGDRNVPTISAKVTSPHGNNLHHKENATSGQFAFTTSETGNYLACFSVDSRHKGINANVNLEWRIGIAARDWQTVARKERIEGVELELKRLEATVEAIRENLVFLRNREAEMRRVSEITNSRVAWFSIISLGICIGVSTFQLWHLKCFFHKKKLI